MNAPLRKVSGVKLLIGGTRNDGRIVPKNVTDILYGYKPDCTKFYALNHVLIIGKYHIFQAWLDNSPTSFKIFHLVLKDKILCKSRIAFKNNTLSKFRSKWTTLCALVP